MRLVQSNTILVADQMSNFEVKTEAPSVRRVGPYWLSWDYENFSNRAGGSENFSNRAGSYTMNKARSTSDMIIIEWAGDQRVR
jgi:hypothetical protein